MDNSNDQGVRLLPRLARLSRDSLIYGVGGAVSRYTGLILLPIYTRTFTAEKYGVLESVINLGALLIAVAVLGFDGATNLLYFETSDSQERRRISSLWVWVATLISLPLTLALIVGADWISLLVSGTAEHADLFRVGMAVLPFSLLHVVFTSLLRLSFRPRVYAALNFSLTTLIALASIALVIFAGMGLMGALWGTFIGTAVVALAGAWSVRDLVSLTGLGERARALLGRLLRLGLPLVPASVALWVVSFSSTYFLIQLVGAEETGVFRVGARLAAILGLGVWAFQLAWGPYSLSIAQEPDAPRTYARVATLYSAGAVGASLVLSIFAPLLLALLAPGDYAGAAPVTGILCVAAAALGAYYVVVIGTNLAQRTGLISWTNVVAAAANLALNWLLIPAWGAIGAGVATLAANLLAALLIYLISQRLHPLPFQGGHLAVIWPAGLVCVGAISTLNAATSAWTWQYWAVALLVVASYLAIVFLSGAITLNEVRAGWRAAMGRR